MNKNTKIFWSDKEVKWRNQYSRYSKFKMFLKKLFKYTLATLAVAGFIIAVYMIGAWADKTIVVKEVEVIKEVDNLSGKIIQLKSEVLTDLRNCESEGYKEDDGLIIFDSNKVASIGLYQFQKTTVIHYYKTIYGKDITGKQAIEIALDEEKSLNLANDIIFSNDSKGLGNWYNCAVKKGLYDRVKWINKISQ